MRRVPRCVAPGLLALAVGAGWGCGTTDIPVLLVSDGGLGASVEGGGEARVDAGIEAQAPTPDAASPGTNQDYCSGTGPPVLVETTDGGSTAICPDQLAQRAFRYALCTCTGYVSDHALVTDAFDGSQGAYDPSTAIAGGSVGVNGNLHSTGLLQISGSLWASDSTDITTSTVTVSGDLHAQGELHPAPTLAVQGDAWMASGIQTSGDVTVNGTLHVPAGEPTSVTGTFTHGAIDAAPFQVLQPCDCDPADLVDVAGVVATYQTDNDDASLGISPTMFENVQVDTSSTPTPLRCGRIFLTRIGANAPIHWATTGRVALFVAGDLSVSDLQIDVPPGTELDLFVAGSVNVRGAFQVGDQNNPARARTYVGGTSVNLQSAATLLGNLYAPHATITLGGTAPTALYGSVFANGLSSGSDLTIHYDEAILTPSSPPLCAAPTTCQTCNDCNGQACNGNAIDGGPFVTSACGLCTADSQCCRPLICSPQGTCIPVVTLR
jgi:hypothetical protein